MKNIKKVLSVVLAVVMALSALTLVAFAHTYTGQEEAGTTSVKYEVTQVASAYDTVSGETYNAVDNDIYAVTVYAKAAEGTGIIYLAAPIQFDNTKFEPMMLIDEGDLYTGYQGFWADVEIQNVGFYSLPARFSDTNMYKADGTVTTSNVQGKVYGLGNAKAGALSTTVAFMDAGSPGAAAFLTGQPSNIGIVNIILDDASLVSKTAYLNTEKGLANSTDYLEMATVYFKRAEGVSEADCYGAEFGISSADDFGPQLTSEVAANGGYSSSANPKTIINFINGAVESPVKALATLTAAEGAKQQQIQFFLADGATKTYTTNDIDKVDYRFIAQFSTSAFPIDYNADGSVNDTDIDEVGFTMAKAGEATEAQLKAFDAAGIAALSKDDGTIRKCWTAKISTDTAGGAAFAFSCRIKGIAVTGGTVASEYIVVPYLVANGQVYYGQAMTSGAQARFNAYADTFLAKKNAA